MSAQIHLAELLSLIEETAHAARVTLSNASMLSASMDLRSGQAMEQHNAAMSSLRGLTGILHQPPPDPSVNGRLKIAG